MFRSICHWVNCKYSNLQLKCSCCFFCNVVVLLVSQFAVRIYILEPGVWIWERFSWSFSNGLQRLTLHSLFGTVEVVLILNSNYSKNANIKISFSKEPIPPMVSSHTWQVWASTSLRITTPESPVAKSWKCRPSKTATWHATWMLPSWQMQPKTKYEKIWKNGISTWKRQLETQLGLSLTQNHAKNELQIENHTLTTDDEGLNYSLNSV